MANYPQRRITLTACVLLGLGFALLRLPLDQKTYAQESAKRLRGESKAGGEGKGGGGKGTSSGERRKGGMVRLSEVKPVNANHDQTLVMKQVLIINGQVPHVTNFSRAVLGPGHEVEQHTHKSMDEIFYGEEGKGIIEVDGTVVQVSPGTCVHIAAGQKHRLKNTGDEDMVLLYFGIAVEPALEGGGGGGGVGRGGGKTTTKGEIVFHAIGDDDRFRGGGRQ